jgi:rhodanese-related sulfurtransferase
LDEKLKVSDKNSTYLVYCHSTNASRLGAQKFVEAGFKNVYRLEGNYKAWEEAGYPTEI